MRVAMLLSGGVDSSVALHLLRRAGHDVTAFYLKIWLEDELAYLGDCPWEEDLSFARTVCEQESVPLEVIPLQRLYHQRVVGELIEELRAGNTPSPDIWCNRRVKFGAFNEALAARGDTFDAIGSGHYARVTVGTDGTARLLSAVDPVKDQTYFLCQMTQQQLVSCLFPLGDYPKAKVRQLAVEAGLATADRPDSQGICFLGKLDYEGFVAAHLGEKRGAIVEAESGRRLGDHRGYWFHTLGQRRGLGLSGGPWYVVSKDPGTNEVRVSNDPHSGLGPGRLFTVPAPHWIRAEPQTRELEVKVRHGPQRHGAQVRSLPDGTLAVELSTPDPGLAPGQFAVFYDGDECLGGGAIQLRGRVGEGA
ncbi:MAG: tRNA 2-thiouridine(34) synthase MnmA [Thermoanaerobaculia bacterium]|nr:tRNA 2-thiouridine(34) synthase MnmA [Thermoanaerobaculia bacterium]